MIKRIALGLLTFFIASQIVAQREVIDKVIANVGGEYVLLSELEEQIALIGDRQGGQIPPDARCLMLDNLLTQKLLVNQAKIDSVEVRDEEVEDQMNARIEQILDYMGGDVNQFEEYYGQSIGEVKQSFREDLKSQLLADRMRNKVMEGISVTPSEVKAFFKKIPRDSLPYFNSEVEIGEIVMKPEINATERQKAIDKLDGIRKRIVEGGEDFAEVAKKYSDDFASARIGGELGWTKRGKFVPAFEAAAYKLDENEISSVVESEFGFHLIQLLGRRGNSISTRHILIKPEITDADLQLTEHKLDSVRQLLMSDSISFSRAVKAFGNKEVQSFNNDGKLVNPASGNSFFEIGDLEPSIYFTIDTMKVGGFSKSFSFSDPRGETFFRIVQLQSRTQPHVASLEKDYAKIQTATIEQKKSSETAKWVEEKVFSTYIRIDQTYLGCAGINKWLEGSKP
ncbi:MAG: peptidylprolyl isomerase [Saprospiraceae bacterium]|nr:peptidylprolyl isomerase [Saprospiraceae bacterium]MCF8252701.1 peptidylprolyl isomerase [Saprospiraceae bacterium]MCF8282925.1 peptidylprolyl isomerase [Bacteroidales bacterium]MCF8311651.1 peptidylprolyl isomerase [Saprospiraceae bacterium]MCF8440992.1 peptidylprolyl isomerase [Saprospiraceae bacterium]